MKRRNPNRGIVLALHDAAAIHRMLELWLDDRKFFNPIEAFEAKQAVIEAKERLGEKLIAVFHGWREHCEAVSAQWEKRP